MVSRGHDERRILFEYSIDKVLLYVDAAQENRRNEQFDLLEIYHNPKRFLKALRTEKRKSKKADAPKKLGRLMSLLRGRA